MGAAILEAVDAGCDDVFTHFNHVLGGVEDLHRGVFDPVDHVGGLIDHGMGCALDDGANSRFGRLASEGGSFCFLPSSLDLTWASVRQSSGAFFFFDLGVVPRPTPSAAAFFRLPNALIAGSFTVKVR